MAKGEGDVWVTEAMGRGRSFGNSGCNFSAGRGLGPVEGTKIRALIAAKRVNYAQVCQRSYPSQLGFYGAGGAL